MGRSLPIVVASGIVLSMQCVQLGALEGSQLRDSQLEQPPTLRISEFKGFIGSPAGGRLPGTSLRSTVVVLKPGPQPQAWLPASASGPY